MILFEFSVFCHDWTTNLVIAIAVY